MLRARYRLCVASALFVLWAATTLPATAQQQPVRIGIGTGLAFLPVYICDDLKLVEKYGKDAHLDLKAIYARSFGAGPLQEALGAGSIDLAPFGLAPLLAAWEKAKNTPRQILAASGMSTLSPVLLTNRENVHSLADLRSTDRIAIPTATAPQLYFLQMQSEKIFGRYDRLRDQIVVMPHPEATAALMSGAGPVTAYFGSPPFTEIALANGRIHKVFSGNELIGGKASFLIMGAGRSYVLAHPDTIEAIDKAIDEAAHLIHDDPHRAAEIFLAHEPSRVLDVTAMTEIIDGIKDEFGIAVHGVETFAGFMGRHGELKAPPQKWQEIVVPALMNSSST